MTLLRVTAGHVFDGIKAGGYQIQEDQPVIIDEKTLKSGFTKRTVGKNKVTQIEVTFVVSSGAAAATELAAWRAIGASGTFDYYSPATQTTRRAKFNVFVGPVSIVLSDSGQLCDEWKVTLDQSDVSGTAVTTTTTVSSFASANSTTTWTNGDDTYADDNAYAWTHGALNTNHDLTLSGYSLPTIPDDAVIDSVVIEFAYRVSNTSSAATLSLQCLHGSTPMGDGWTSTSEKTTRTKMTTAANGTWSVADLNDDTIAVRFRVYRTGSSATPYYCLYYAKVLVTYTVEV